MWDIDNFDGLRVVAANILIDPLGRIQGPILILGFASGARQQSGGTTTRGLCQGPRYEGRCDRRNRTAREPMLAG